MAGLAACLQTVGDQFLYQDLFQGGVCFLCNSPSYLASACLQKSSGGGFSPKPQVNFCKTKQKADPVSYQPKQVIDRACMNYASMQPDNSCEHHIASKWDSTVNHMQLAKEITWTEDSQDHVKPSCDDGLVKCQGGMEGPSDEILQEGWLCLKYVDVDIDGIPDTVTALNDSGCQLRVVRADTIRSLNLPKLGEAKLKGISDHLVLADIIRIELRLTTGREFVNITCAVAEKLHHSLILGSDIVEKIKCKTDG